LDVHSSTAVSQSKITPVRAVETLLNLYLLHLESNEITPIIDGMVHYSLKIATRADHGNSNDDETMDDESSDNAIVDLATWNFKSTFVVYFRCLFKHFIIKARSVKLPNDSKKKNELETICTEWLELNELFRKFVSFVTLDQIYKRNAMVNTRTSIYESEVTLFIRFFRQFYAAPNNTSMCFERARCQHWIFTSCMTHTAPNNF
jgi:hypothetical protein